MTEDFERKGGQSGQRDQTPKVPTDSAGHFHDLYSHSLLERPFRWREIDRRFGHVGRDIGRVVALNTVGGIGGTVITGFRLSASDCENSGNPRHRRRDARTVCRMARLFEARRRTLGRDRIAMAAFVAAVLTPSDRLANLSPSGAPATLITMLRAGLPRSP